MPVFVRKLGTINRRACKAGVVGSNPTGGSTNSPAIGVAKGEASPASESEPDPAPSQAFSPARFRLVGTSGRTFTVRWVSMAITLPRMTNDSEIDARASVAQW
ncbi:MAG: hypothetical protein JWQ12_1807 [Glaciihabitans sp.]|nr:hypothetical protein [Glaciihabitans sp.]